MTNMTISERVTRAENTWEREARRVIMMAQEAGFSLSEEDLMLADVRDLMALRLRLRAALHRGTAGHGKDAPGRMLDLQRAR